MSAHVRDGRAVLSITPDDVERARAFTARVEQARVDLAFQGPFAVTVDLADGHSVEMPGELMALLSEILELVGRGCTVTVGSIPNEVTTTVAAKMLSVSRPTLMKLIGRGVLPAHKVGSHTRLFSADVLEYREIQSAEQREAFRQLRELEDELGLDD